MLFPCFYSPPEVFPYARYIHLGPEDRFIEGTFGSGVAPIEEMA